jgi:hypothetical protein
LNLDGLPEQLPDLDDLTDDAADIRSRRIADEFGMESFVLTHRENSSALSLRDAQRQKKAARSIGRFPHRGEYLHMVVGQEFAGFDLIPAFLDLAGPRSTITKLYLTTLGFSRENLNQLARLIEAGRIPAAAVKIICGDFFRRADPGLWDIGKMLSRERGFGFRSYRNHTKLILALLGDRHLVCESSANLRSCANIEAFTLTDSPRLFRFHERWITRCFRISKP